MGVSLKAMKVFFFLVSVIFLCEKNSIKIVKTEGKERLVSGISIGKKALTFLKVQLFLFLMNLLFKWTSVCCLVSYCLRTTPARLRGL